MDTISNSYQNSTVCDLQFVMCNYEIVSRVPLPGRRLSHSQRILCDDFIKSQLKICLAITVDPSMQGGFFWIKNRYKTTLIRDCINWMNFSLKNLHGDGECLITSTL